jgi:hypothetical protein
VNKYVAELRRLAEYHRFFHLIMSIMLGLSLLFQFFNIVV